VILIHGHGEHSSRYAYAAAGFNARGYRVISGDLPGNGRSPGLRGHIDRFEDYLEIVEAWVNEVLQMSDAGERLFLLGHSAGGLIVTRYLQSLAAKERSVPIHGVVLSSPALRLKMHVPAWKAVMGRALNQIVPRLTMPSGLRKLNVTRHPDISKVREDDPLMVHVASVRYYNEMLQAQASAMAEAGSIRLPILLMHGGADVIADPATSLEFAKKLSSSDKSIKILPGLHHEILNEPERDEVIRDIADWLDLH
jgi:lysophospholipase